MMQNPNDIPHEVAVIAHKSALVAGWLQQYQRGDISYEAAIDNAIAQLAEDFDQRKRWLSDRGCDLDLKPLASYLGQIARTHFSAQEMVVSNSINRVTKLVALWAAVESISAAQLDYLRRQLPDPIQIKKPYPESP